MVSFVQNTNQVLPSVAVVYVCSIKLVDVTSMVDILLHHIFTKILVVAYQNAIKNYTGGSNLDFPTVVDS